MEAGSLDEAHQDFVITHSILRTVAESYFAHNDIVAQEPFGDIIVSADFGIVQTDV